MTVAGTVSTLRVTGVPSGYPSEQESNVKVRFVDEGFEVMGDLETPLLSRVGGPNQFQVDNTKYEWVLGDTYSDRGDISGAHSNSVTTLTLDGAYAHRFPRGTVLKIEDELVWVSAQATTSTLTIVRAYAGTSAAAHASGVEFRVAGFSEVEGTSITLRGSALRDVPYNHLSIYKTGSSESWMQSEAAIYGRRGATMPEMMADSLAQFWVDVEAAVIEGQRYAGSGTTDPPMTGGLRFFGTSANGATVIDCGGAKISSALLNTGFDGSYDAVGASKMSHTVLTGVGAMRALRDDFISPFGNLSANDQRAVQRFTNLENEYGSFEFMGPFKRIPADEMWIVNTALIEVGHFGQLGRFHEFGIATDGDFNSMGIYGAYGNKFKGIPGIVRLHNFVTS